MTTATTTRSGHPKVPVLDTAAIHAAAEKRVQDALNGITDPRDRLAVLGDLDAEANAVKTEWEPVMRRQALSLALHEGARAVNRSIGVSREAFSRMTRTALGDWPERPLMWDETVRERARARKVHYYSKAVTELPEIAAKVETAKAVLEAIRPLRDELVRELFAAGLKRVEIAEIIGRNPSRVSHITGGGREE